MKGRIAQRAYYGRWPRRSTSPCRTGRRLTGRRYGSIDAYRCDDADEILVAMGTIADTARAVVDGLRVTRDARSAPLRHRVPAIPGRPAGRGARAGEARRGRRADRRPGRRRQPADPRDQGRALRGGSPGRRRPSSCSRSRPASGPGTSSAGDLAAVFDRLARSRAGDPAYAVLGIRHPLAIAPVPIDIRPPGAFSVRGHSIGGLGSITTNKLLATLIGELFGKHVQAYPRYGSEKKGLPTSYNLTVADVPDPVARRARPGRLRAAARRRRLRARRSAARPGRRRHDLRPVEPDRRRPRSGRPSRRRRVPTSLPGGSGSRRSTRQRSPGATPRGRTSSCGCRASPGRRLPAGDHGSPTTPGSTATALLAAVGSRLRRFYGKRGDDVIAANMEVVAAAFDGVIDVSEALGLPPGVERSLAVPAERPREP